MSLDLDGSVVLEFNDDSNRYTFIDGNSAFNLVKLPSRKHPYPIKLRTFVKKNESREETTFFPRMLFLNQFFKSTRMLSEPVMEYSPETWASQASLAGLFEVNPQLGEKYLLVYTSRLDQVKTSMIETEEDIYKVLHVGKGLIELIDDPD